MGDWPVGTVISAAKHRFCQFSKPLARFCLHLAPMLTTINKIAISGVQWAKQWLKSLAASKLLVLAMMADMSHAAIDLCRFFL